ncbi:DUF4157 domain-containing protein [Burkholderiaceae bacterium UC74_6]
MKPDFVPEMKPLGPQLQAAAHALLAARFQEPAWLAPLARVTQRAAQSPLAQAGRFARVEAVGLRQLDAMALPEGLPDGVRGRLRSELGPVADELRVHHDEAADRLAQQHGADAVSIGPDLYFARGRYQPHDSQGFALLAHEAVHAEHALRPHAQWQRSGTGALAAEEARAHAVEQAMRTGGRTELGPRAPAQATAPPAAPAASGNAPAAQRPMAAASSRSFEPPVAGSGIDMEALRQTLMRDLMSQIRAETERGG